MANISDIPAITTIPPEVVQFLCSCHQDYTLYHKELQLHLNRWIPTWRARFNKLDTKALLAYEVLRSRLELHKSNIPNAGIGLFTTFPIVENEVVGYFYGTLGYDGLTLGTSHRRSVYDDGDLKDFKKSSYKLQFNTSCGRPIYIYAAPFCPMRFINGAKYT